MQTILEAYKATMRGNLIAINATKRKKEKIRLQEIQDELKKKKEELKRKPGGKRYYKKLINLGKIWILKCLKKYTGTLKNFSKDLSYLQTNLVDYWQI